LLDHAELLWDGADEESVAGELFLPEPAEEVSAEALRVTALTLPAADSAALCAEPAVEWAAPATPPPASPAPEGACAAAAGARAHTKAPTKRAISDTRGHRRSMSGSPRAVLRSCPLP
jgi:hypothetical protein